MIDSKAFAQLIPQLEARIREAVAAGLAEAAAMVAEEAKSMIGHEQAEWLPLAPSTIERKGSADQPLLETGEMRDTIEFKVEGLTAIVGSDDPKAVAHEHGTGHVPPRPFLSSAAMHKGPEIAALIAEKIKLTLGEE